jgi:hypothetical protein
VSTSDGCIAYSGQLSERAEDSWKARELLQRALYAVLLGFYSSTWLDGFRDLPNDHLQEFLELSQKLHKQFPERPPYFLAVALALKGRHCDSREERMGYLPEAYRLWFIALDQGWDSQFKSAARLFYDAFYVLWHDLVDLERNEDATNALINFLSFASLDQWGPWTMSKLLSLGKLVFVYTNRYQDPVKIFLAWLAMDPQRFLQHQAEPCLFLIASSVLASDHQTARKYIPLLIQGLDSLYDPQDDEHDLAIDMEANVKRLEAWQRLVPTPATANQIALRNFCETLPEREQAALQRTGALVQLQLVGLASDGEFLQQFAALLQKGALLFGNMFASCFKMPAKADNCIRDHILSFTTVYYQSTLSCASLALLLTEIADIVGYPSCLLTDDRLWARFVQLLVEYSNRYAAQQPQSSTADDDNWINAILWGSSLQSDFLAFAKATASSAADGQIDKQTR